MTSVQPLVMKRSVEMVGFNCQAVRGFREFMHILVIAEVCTYLPHGAPGGRLVPYLLYQPLTLSSAPN